MNYISIQWFNRVLGEFSGYYCIDPGLLWAAPYRTHNTIIKCSGALALSSCHSTSKHLSHVISCWRALCPPRFCGKTSSLKETSAIFPLLGNWEKTLVLIYSSCISPILPLPESHYTGAASTDGKQLYSPYQAPPHLSILDILNDPALVFTPSTSPPTLRWPFQSA